METSRRAFQPKSTGAVSPGWMYVLLFLLAGLSPGLFLSCFGQLGALAPVLGRALRLLPGTSIAGFCSQESFPPSLWYTHSYVVRPRLEPRGHWRIREPKPSSAQRQRRHFSGLGRPLGFHGQRLGLLADQSDDGHSLAQKCDSAADGAANRAEYSSIRPSSRCCLVCPGFLSGRVSSG